MRVNTKEGKRKNVWFTKEYVLILAKLSKELGKDEAEIVRDAFELYVASGAYNQQNKRDALDAYIRKYMGIEE